MNKRAVHPLLQLNHEGVWRLVGAQWRLQHGGEYEAIPTPMIETLGYYGPSIFSYENTSEALELRRKRGGNSALSAWYSSNKRHHLAESGGERHSLAGRAAHDAALANGRAGSAKRNYTRQLLFRSAEANTKYQYRECAIWVTEEEYEQELRPFIQLLNAGSQPRVEIRAGLTARRPQRAVQPPLITIAVDLGHVPTPTQVAATAAFTAAKGSPPFFMSLIATGSRDRDNWVPERFRQPGWVRRLHKSAAGSYFWLASSNRVAGLALRPDGSTLSFFGDWMRPLTCIACGDPTERDDLLCSTVHEVPLGILRHLRFRSDVPNSGPAAPSSEVLQEVVARDGGVVARPAMPIRPPSTSTSASTVRSTSYVPPQRPGYWESMARGAAASAWGTFKFMLLMIIFAIAAGRH